MNKFPLFFILLLSGQQAKCYVSGYSRLYNPSLQKTIDILYDIHAPKALNSYDFQQLLVDEIKPQLYETESFLLEVFEKLNCSNQASNTAIVAESSGDDVYSNDVFLGYINRLVSRRMKNITFIDADTFRAALRVNKEMPMLNLPRPSIQAWHDLYGRSFEHYKNKVNIFEGWNLGVTDEETRYHRLADVEMLWHILSLRHKRIIVYCGAWHASNVRQFLMKHAGYKEIQGYDTYRNEDLQMYDHHSEIPLSALQPLANNGSHQIKQRGKKQSGQPRGSRRKR
jgi:hypothetical protein